MTQLTQAKILQINPLSQDILQVLLEPSPYIPYEPGQYLQIKLDEELLSYSIANAPIDRKIYELHIRHDENNPRLQLLFSALRQKPRLELKLPLGDCHLARLDKVDPILFIASGTGFAPIHSMIEALINASEDTRVFELYWLGRGKDDFYLETKIQAWLKTSKLTRYTPFYPYTENQALIQTLIEDHKKDLAQQQIVIAGSFSLAYASREALIAEGAGRLYSDAFSFPRSN